MRFHSESKRTRSKITVPAHVHPLVKLVFAEMQRQCVTYDELEWRSGVLRSTFKAWRTHNRCGFESIEAALGGLGWQITVAPAIHVIPDGLRADLQAVADKHGLSTLPALEYLAEFAGGWSYPDCRIAARRRLNQQQERPLAA